MAEPVSEVFDSQFLRRGRRSQFTVSTYKRGLKDEPPRLISDVYSTPRIGPNTQLIPRFKPHISNRTTPLTSRSSNHTQAAHNRTERSRVLVRTGLNRPKQSRIKRARYSKYNVVLLSMALVLFISGLYFALLGYKADHISIAQARSLTAEANVINKNTGQSSSSVPSTSKPSPGALASYSVAPNLPRYLLIPKLNVDARVLSVGVTSSGAMGIPGNVYDTAWYNESSQPGQPGAVLIDGHISSWTTNGVFYGLKTLVAGDNIKIVRGDKTTFNYRVVSSKVFGSSNVDMTSAMTPIVAGKPGLNLISCAGDVIPGTNQFNERIIVYAVQI